MDEAVIRQMNEISKWIEAVLSNSKPIHQLKELDESSELYVAVSNGNETGKIRFKPNEVTKNDLDLLRNMQLLSDSTGSVIYIEDGNGDVLTSLSLNLFTGDFVRNSEMEAVEIPDWSVQLERNINF